MEKDNQEKSYIAELLASLDEQNISLIDFDRMKKWLSATASKWELYDNLKSELDDLRGDYQLRIAGMVKAIAAADRKNDNWKQALNLIDSLKTLSGQELIECYRKTSVRFRDMFPVGFNFLSAGQASSTVLKRLENYK